MYVVLTRIASSPPLISLVIIHLFDLYFSRELFLASDGIDDGTCDISHPCSSLRYILSIFNVSSDCVKILTCDFTNGTSCLECSVTVSMLVSGAPRNFPFYGTIFSIAQSISASLSILLFNFSVYS